MDHAEIIRKLGGYREVAENLGFDRSTVFKWSRDGIPPLRWQLIVDIAKEQGVKGVNMNALASGAADNE